MAQGILYCCADETGTARGTHAALAKYHYDHVGVCATPVYPVVCAGEYSFHENVLKLNYKSGHYRPKWDTFMLLYEGLAQDELGLGLRPTQTQAHDFCEVDHDKAAQMLYQPPTPTTT